MAKDRPLIAQIRGAVEQAAASGETVPLLYTLFLTYRHLYHAIRRCERDMAKDATLRSFCEKQIALYNAGLDAIDIMSDALEVDDQAAVGAALTRLEGVSDQVEQLFREKREASS
jgi:hypothetical protein